MFSLVLMAKRYPWHDLDLRQHTETLRRLRGDTGWFWLVCDHCMRFKATAVVPLILRLGLDPLSEIRRRARCSKCGGQGASTQHVSWGIEAIGWESWPVKPKAPETKKAPCHRPFGQQQGEFTASREEYAGQVTAVSDSTLVCSDFCIRRIAATYPST